MYLKIRCLICNMPLKSPFLEAFNNQLNEFIKDIKTVLADHYEVTLACHAITGLKMINKTLIISVWHEGITLVYMDKIKAKDYEFFLEESTSFSLYIPWDCLSFFSSSTPYPYRTMSYRGCP